MGDSKQTSDGSTYVATAARDEVRGGGTTGDSGDRGDLGPGREKFSMERAYRELLMVARGEGDSLLTPSIDLVGLNGGVVVVDVSVYAEVGASCCKATEEKLRKWRFSALIPRSSRRGA